MLIVHTLHAHQRRSGVETMKRFTDDHRTNPTCTQTHTRQQTSGVRFRVNIVIITTAQHTRVQCDKLTCIHTHTRYECTCVRCGRACARECDLLPRRPSHFVRARGELTCTHARTHARCVRFTLNECDNDSRARERSSRESRVI